MDGSSVELQSEVWEEKIVGRQCLREMILVGQKRGPVQFIISLACEKDFVGVSLVFGVQVQLALAWGQKTQTSFLGDGKPVRR